LRFLVFTQYFPPEVGASQARLSAFVRELKSLGHEVEVITGFPNHPTGRIFPEYRGKFYVREEWEGIPVHRVWLYPSTGAGLKRMLNYLSFTLTSLWGFLKAQRPDYIFVESPPLFLSVPAWLVSRFWGVPFIFNVADLWPDSVKELGLMSNRFILRIAEWLELWTYRRAAYVNAVTEGIKTSLIDNKSVPRSKILFLPNGADVTLYDKRCVGNDQLLARFGLPNGAKVVLYAGTHGFAHGLETAIKAAKILKDKAPEVRFMFVGGGSEKDKIISFANEIGCSNVLFKDPMPQNELVDLYCLAHVGLVMQRNLPFFEGHRPAKTFTYMAASKPVIFSGLGEGARLVEEARAGLVVPPEDPEALANAVKTLVENPQLAEELGRNGRRYVEEHLSWSALVQDWLEQLEGRQVQRNSTF